MKVTVVTVCYNVVDLIEETVKSVVEQSYPDVEYIIVDGGSDDGTMDVIRKYKDRIATIISEKDSGIYDAMNKGIKAATGDYINFMNAGDKFASDDAVEKLFADLEVDSDVVYGNAVVVNPDGTKRFEKGGTDLKLIGKRPIYRHNAAFVRTAVHKAHPFDLTKADEFEYALDYNNIFNLWREGFKFQKVDTTVVEYDRNGTSDKPIKNVLLTFKISHQYSNPTIKERVVFCWDLIKATRRWIIRKI